MKKNLNDVTNREARKTAVIVAVVFVAVSALFWYRARLTAAVVSVAIGGFLLLIGLFVPPFAKIFHRVWFQIAFALGWINSRILLAIIYFLVFVPYGLISRLAGRDPLKVRQKPETTYWHKRERTRQTKEQFERLF